MDSALTVLPACFTLTTELEREYLLSGRLFLII
jgi:hypothetical protein